MVVELDVGRDYLDDSFTLDTPKESRSFNIGVFGRILGTSHIFKMCSTWTSSLLVHQTKGFTTLQLPEIPFLGQRPKKKMGLEHSNYLWNLGETFLCERLGGFQIFPISFQKSRKHIPLYRWKFLPLSLAEVDKISSLLLIHVMTQRTMMFRADASRNIRGFRCFFFRPKGATVKGQHLRRMGRLVWTAWKQKPLEQASVPMVKNSNRWDDRNGK